MRLEVVNVVATASAVLSRGEWDAPVKAGLAEGRWLRGGKLMLKCPGMKSKLVTVFPRPGVLVFLGARDTASPSADARVLVSLYEKAGCRLEVGEVVVKNVVAKGDLGLGVRPALVVAALRGAVYEPAIFPAAVVPLDMDGRETRALVFHTGRVILPGLRSESEVLAAGARLVELLLAAAKETEKHGEFLFFDPAEPWRRIPAHEATRALGPVKLGAARA